MERSINRQPSSRLVLNNVTLVVPEPEWRAFVAAVLMQHAREAFEAAQLLPRPPPRAPPPQRLSGDQPSEVLGNDVSEPDEVTMEEISVSKVPGSTGGPRPGVGGDGGARLPNPSLGLGSHGPAGDTVTAEAETPTDAADGGPQKGTDTDAATTAGQTAGELTHTGTAPPAPTDAGGVTYEASSSGVASESPASEVTWEESSSGVDWEASGSGVTLVGEVSDGTIAGGASSEQADIPDRSAARLPIGEITAEATAAQDGGVRVSGAGGVLSGTAGSSVAMPEQSVGAAVGADVHADEPGDSAAGSGAGSGDGGGALGQMVVEGVVVEEVGAAYGGQQPAPQELGRRRRALGSAAGWTLNRRLLQASDKARSALLAFAADSKPLSYDPTSGTLVLALVRHYGWEGTDVTITFRLPDDAPPGAALTTTGMTVLQYEELAGMNIDFHAEFPKEPPAAPPSPAPAPRGRPPAGPSQALGSSEPPLHASPATLPPASSDGTGVGHIYGPGDQQAATGQAAASSPRDWAGWVLPVTVSLSVAGFLLLLLAAAGVVFAVLRRRRSASEHRTAIYTDKRSSGGRSSAIGAAATSATGPPPPEARPGAGRASGGGSEPKMWMNCVLAGSMVRGTNSSTSVDIMVAGSGRTGPAGQIQDAGPGCEPADGAGYADKLQASSQESVLGPMDPPSNGTLFNHPASRDTSVAQANRAVFGQVLYRMAWASRAGTELVTPAGAGSDTGLPATGPTAAWSSQSTGGDPSGGLPVVVAEESFVRVVNAELCDEELDVCGTLGSGSYGVVYLGTWRGLSVAVKTIVVSDAAAAESRARQRAVLEAAISMAMSHPNIVATYTYDLKPLIHDPLEGAGPAHGESEPGAGLEAYKLYIVQELCNGGSLQDALSRGIAGSIRAGGAFRLMALRLALDVAQGMRHIHSSRVVHGDLKPDNVLLVVNAADPVRGLALGDDRRASKDFAALTAKVADFGLSLPLAEGATHASQRFHGTPAYVAPEVATQGQLSPRADVWSFGILLVTLFYGCTLEDMYAVYSGLGLTGPEGLHRAIHSLLLPDMMGSAHLSYAELTVACLSVNPRERPDFEDIAARLLHIFHSSGTDGEL
ncbi:hypothetical protein GPECTOR_15g342 [Gonium pectorale]|uniref:Protein kinase domain-containing protein n=1 Tax=Gonium pectorale TaxID=33097 RepID=A0A150GLK4_GONPE|nr:hypothetical protein GPECTOR_15g342 [Gonium pectorale]|eukprot:KXZ50658.1 hypothetical protein GPECTOR_15g342 [Gonium pectorale]